MIKRTALALTAALALAGCSETQFAEMMGAGKYSPDERAVGPSGNLAMPPDLRLPPPGTAVAAAEPVSPDPAPVQTAAIPAAPTSTDPAAAAPDNFAKYGISKTNPDGTPKEKAVLYEELRKAEMAEKKQRNPNYGTIWNMGNIFTDE